MKIETKKNKYVIDCNIRSRKKDCINVRIIKNKQLGCIFSFDTHKDTNEYEILKDCVDLIFSHELKIFDTIE